MSDMAIASAAVAPSPVRAPRDLPPVRLAAPGDEDEIMAMCRRLHAENGLFALDDDLVRALLQRYFRRDKVIVGVIGAPGHIEASTCIVFSTMYYTPEWHLAELWNFVDEPFRQSRNLEALIGFGKNSADRIGLPLITGIITDTRTAAKVRLYRRLLGTPAGAFFVYGGQWIADRERSADIWKVMLKEEARMREVPVGSRIVSLEELTALGDGDPDFGRRRLKGFLDRAGAKQQA